MPMIEQYLGDYMAKMGVDRDTLAALGRQHPGNEQEPFGMTVLALKLANVSNGVSKLHGSVSRQDVEGPLAGTARRRGADHEHHQRRPHAELAVARRSPSSTTATSASSGKSGRPTSPSGSAWNRSPTRSCGGRTSAAASGSWPSPARRLQAQLKRRGSPPSEVAAAEEVLDPDALTIGFARRFATYKRGDLIFRNADRLAAAPQQTRTARCSSSSPARPTRRTTAARNSSSAWCSSRASRSSAAAWSSSKTTT